MSAANLTSAIIEALAGSGRPAPVAVLGNRATASKAYAPYPAPAPRPAQTAPVNYVHHTRAAHRKLLASASRPHHVSAYMALFHQWNNGRFPKRLKIERAQLMHEARIGSKATLIAVLRDLEAWGLIRYHPNRNSNQGTHISIVELSSEDGPEVGHPTATPRPGSGPTDGKPHGPEMGQPDGPEVVHRSPPVGPEVVHHSLLDKTSTSKLVDKNVTGDAARKKKKGVADPELGKKASQQPTGIHSARIRDAAAQPSGASASQAKSRAPALEVPFAQSEVADLAAFRTAFTGTDYELADLAFYHELVGSWRDKNTGEAPRRKDWVATAKRFMLNDARDNRLKLAPGVQQHSAGPISPKVPTTGYRSSRFD